MDIITTTKKIYALFCRFPKHFDSFWYRLDYQPLFGKGARAPTRTRHERAAEIEPSFGMVDTYSSKSKYIEAVTSIIYT